MKNLIVMNYFIDDSIKLLDQYAQVTKLEVKPI